MRTTPHDDIKVMTFAELDELYPELNPPIIPGLLREAETLNLVVSPRLSGHNLTESLGIAVASGRPWLGLPVEAGKVLHIDATRDELAAIANYRRTAERLGTPLADYGDNLYVCSVSDQRLDIDMFQTLMSAPRPGSFQLLVIQGIQPEGLIGASRRTIGAMNAFFNAIEHHAIRIGCAVVIPEIDYRADDRSAASTDAGSYASHVDSHLVVSSNANGDLVMTAECRSWPPFRHRAPLA